MERLRRGERVDHFETVRLAKDGRLVDLSVAISPVRNCQRPGDRARRRWRGTSRERKRIEEALRSAERRKDEFLADPRARAAKSPGAADQRPAGDPDGGGATRRSRRAPAP